ncbi:unnamed protein product, partial [Laminaria digitata]
ALLSASPSSQLTGRSLASHSSGSVTVRFMEKERRAPRPRDALVFFAWVLAVQLTGLAAFTKGFFLTRVELGRQSQCDIRSLLSADEVKHLSDVALGQHRGTSP